VSALLVVAVLLAPAPAGAATVGQVVVTAGPGPLSVAVSGYTSYLSNDQFGWIVVVDPVAAPDRSTVEGLTPAPGCVADSAGGSVACEVPAPFPVYTVRGSAVADSISVTLEPCDDPTVDCPSQTPRVDLRGGAGPDVLRTSNGGRIDGGDGNDSIDIASLALVPLAVDAGNGDDVIVDERLDPVSSTATVSITCGAGNDTVRFLRPGDTAAADCEHVYANEGPAPPDVGAQSPSPGGCSVTGTPGNDKLVGTAGDDVICGQGGNDVLVGLGGNDVLVGAAGRDVLFGGAGDDVVDGGGGDDVLRGEAGNDELRGGAGRDLVVYLDAPRSVAADLRAGRASGDGYDGLQAIEGVRGSPHDDRLTGSAGADLLDGSGGADFVAGRGGRDRLSGGGGDDRLVGGFGRDLLIGGIGSNRLDGGAGRDRCFGADAGSRRSCELPVAG
jgi:Ca2+-binding RTX toxin-like protein